MTFKKHLQSHGKSKSTVKHYHSYILDFLAWLDKDNTEVEYATAKEVMSYLNHLQKKGQQNQTRSIRLGVIKQFFNWQIERGVRENNPVAHLKIRGIKQQKIYPILSKKELEEIYHSYAVPKEDDEKASRNWFKNYQLSKARNKAILSLLINQGITTAEAARITTTDLKLKEGKIYISPSRTSDERTLELKSNQIIELMTYQYETRSQLLKYQPDPGTKNLFLSTPTAGKTQAKESLQIWKGFTKELKQQNKSIINLKQIRASVITHWLRQYNLREVQYMAGHRYVSSTEKYLVNHTEDLQKDIDQFHPF